MFRPFVLQGSKDPHIQQLELVSRFGGQAVKNDRRAGSVAEPLHFGGFVRCVTVNDEKNWSTGLVVILRKRKEDLFKPVGANLIVCPALG